MAHQTLRTSLITAAAAVPGLLPHPMRDDAANGAPGVYAKYDWPQSQASEDMEVEHTWTRIPYSSESDGNGVFASSQFWHESYEYTKFNSAGYMGTQVMRSGTSERRVFIFACWDADGSHKVSWTNETGNCGRFGGEGVGSHCIMDYPVQEGVQYKYRYAFSGSDASGAYWTGTVFDPTTDESHMVGTLIYPHLDTFIGFGNVNVQSDDFLEYFVGGDCEGAVTTGVGITGPFFHARTVVATEAYPSYNPVDHCNRSVVDRCIPGGDCDRPNVHLAGGKGVVRDNTDGTALWTPEVAIV